MKNAISSVVFKPMKNKNMGDIYIKNAIAHYASVQAPRSKYQSDKMSERERREYSVTLFVTGEQADYLADVLKLNKQFFEVGVGKNKLRRIKYPLTGQSEEGKKVYDDVKGLFGVTFSCPEYSKKGDRLTIAVIDQKGNLTDALVGNGSKVTVKLFGYMNEDGLWNTRLRVMKIEELVEYEGGGGGEFGALVDDELGVNISSEQLDRYVSDKQDKLDAEKKESEQQVVEDDEDEYGAPKRKPVEEEDLPF
jgi:hypothetical protein